MHQIKLPFKQVRSPFWVRMIQLSWPKFWFWRVIVSAQKIKYTISVRNPDQRQMSQQIQLIIAFTSFISFSSAANFSSSRVSKFQTWKEKVIPHDSTVWHGQLITSFSPVCWRKNMKSLPKKDTILEEKENTNEIASQMSENFKYRHGL